MPNIYLSLNRGKSSALSTPGVLTGPNMMLFHTLEDIHRPVKIAGETCIPAGRYRIRLHNWGKAVKYNELYKDINHRGMLALENVLGFDGILIHTGNDKDDTEGCILIGLTAAPDMVISSKDAYRQFYPVIAAAIEAGDEVWIQIFDKAN